jgi:hypothetical protein
MGGRRGGLPGPESRTGLVRPALTEAEFERRQAAGPGAEPPEPPAEADPGPARGPARTRASRLRPARPRRVQRMFAVEEDLDRKLWLYAIHVGKDRSDVVNDLLRPLVGSMVLYDSRERRTGRNAEAEAEG